MKWKWGIFLLLLLLVGCSSLVEREENIAIHWETAVSSAADATPTANPTATSTPLPPPPSALQVPTATAMPVSTITPSPSPLPPVIHNPANEALAGQAAAWGVPFTILDESNSGVWQFSPDSFIHPLALAVKENSAYLLDAGRVLAINLATPQPPGVMLEPGQAIAGVRVLEPLDLALSLNALFVLDRAGDVYAYDFASSTWLLELYDRPPRSDSANHYYVAVETNDNGRFLLDTNYNYVKRFAAGESDSGWLLPDSRGVDLAAQGDSMYVLLQELDNRTGLLNHYQFTARQITFRPNVAFEQPRQVVATNSAVYVLDHAGERLLMIHPQSGVLLAILQPPPETSAIWADDNHLILAGRDRLFFYNEPQRRAWVENPHLFNAPQPHDPVVLAALPPLRLPIGVSLPARDLQLPGAPRHYRLGVHQGVDLYWRRGAPVTAVAAGTITRANSDYTDPTPAEYAAWDRENQTLGYTSDSALDFYRGRQVWILHDGGLLSRYAHLESIDPAIITGTAVIQGQLLGTVGNSGTPSSQLTGKPDTHVHFDLWIGQHYIGQFLRPVETRDWLEEILEIRN